MKNKTGSEVPWEQQKAVLVELVSMKLPQLYQDLIALLGEAEGKRVYNGLFEIGFKRRAKMFEGKDIGDILMAEEDLFPVMGWHLDTEKKEENGKPAWYEHLRKCPLLDAARRNKLPDPCTITCDLDAVYGEKYKVGKWERLKHLPAGDEECCFRITRFED